MAPSASALIERRNDNPQLRNLRQCFPFLASMVNRPKEQSNGFRHFSVLNARACEKRSLSQEIRKEREVRSPMPVEWYCPPFTHYFCRQRRRHTLKCDSLRGLFILRMCNVRER